MPDIPAFNPFDPAFIADPYPFYHRLREAAPVWKSPLGMWVLTRHADAAAVLKDRRFGKDYVGIMTRNHGPDAMNEPSRASLGHTMLVRDPPDHTRLRSLVTKAFTARRVEEMRPRIAAIVDGLIDRVEKDGRMDIMRDFAYRLPIIVICDMLGIPEEDREQFFTRSRVNGRQLDPVPMSRQELDEANANVLETNAYFATLFDRRRREPRDDLMTSLVHAEEEGDRLTADELHANVSLLFAAGHETTANLIGNGLLALHRHPDQLQMLRDDPALIHGAIEELLRYDSSVQLTGRVTGEPVDMNGQHIDAHQSVVCFLGAANRDPAAHPEPDRLDITRKDIKLLSFGGGIHYCLGAQLARHEAELAFAGLLRRLPSLELPDRDRPQWRRSFTLRGLTSLPAIWQ